MLVRGCIWHMITKKKIKSSSVFKRHYLSSCNTIVLAKAYHLHHLAKKSLRTDEVHRAHGRVHSAISQYGSSLFQVDIICVPHPPTSRRLGSRASNDGEGVRYRAVDGLLRAGLSREGMGGDGRGGEGWGGGSCGGEAPSHLKSVPSPTPQPFRVHLQPHFPQPVPYSICLPGRLLPRDLICRTAATAATAVAAAAFASPSPDNNAAAATASGLTRAASAASAAAVAWTVAAAAKACAGPPPFRLPSAGVAGVGSGSGRPLQLLAATASRAGTTRTASSSEQI
jgi:hypothetical protein